MSARLQIILIASLILATIVTVFKISRKKLDFRYGIGWLALIIILLILAAWPRLLTVISDLIGITTPINTLFVLGFLLMIIMTFSMSAAIGKLNEKLSRMAQSLALTEKRLEEEKSCPNDKYEQAHK